ncbi:hypothetical protein KM043_003575 [Ampulex compressa]|nr:hypothetical protein KM043_003575 [Ampulex compressa]
MMHRPLDSFRQIADLLDVRPLRWARALLPLSLLNRKACQAAKTNCSHLASAYYRDTGSIRGWRLSEAGKNRTFLIACKETRAHVDSRKPPPEEGLNNSRSG